MLFGRGWLHVERMYVLRRRKLLKLLSAEADDAGVTIRILSSASTCGNIARMSGAIFLIIVVNTSSVNVVFAIMAGKVWNMSSLV